MDKQNIFRMLSRGATFSKNVRKTSSLALGRPAVSDAGNTKEYGAKAAMASQVSISDPVNRLANGLKSGEDHVNSTLHVSEVTVQDHVDSHPSDSDSDQPIGSDSEDSVLEDPAKIQLYSTSEASAAFTPVKKRKRRKITKSVEKLAQIKQEEINRYRNRHNIHVHGTDVCEPIECFEDLRTRYNIHDQLIANISSVGYDSPTPIQMQAIPLLLENRNILASAPTGSGKTAAFLIPILHLLEKPSKMGYRAVIVSPTRELAKQTFFEIERLGAKQGFRVHLLENVPKVIKKFQTKKNLAAKFDILVTTPNRLVYLLKAEPTVVSLSNVTWLVIDESDKLFEADKEGGFRDQLGIIYKACDNPGVHRALFSATFAFEVEEWCKANLDNVVMVSIGSRNAATESVDQKLVFVGSESGKMMALRQLLKENFVPPVLIFVQKKQNAKELYKELLNDGIHVDVIHSDREQQERDVVVSNFRAGKTWILIATEVMGRGIDFKGVNLVVNYDFPSTSISYIHRIGRTGRAGQRGKAVTFFTEKDSVNLRSIANVMKRSGCDVPDFMLQLRKPTKSEKNPVKRRKREPKTSVESTKQRREGSLIMKKRKKVVAEKKLHKKVNKGGKEHVGVILRGVNV